MVGYARTYVRAHARTHEHCQRQLSSKFCSIEICDKRENGRTKIEMQHANVKLRLGDWKGHSSTHTRTRARARTQTPHYATHAHIPTHTHARTQTQHHATHTHARACAHAHTFIKKQTRLLFGVPKFCRLRILRGSESYDQNMCISLVETIYFVSIYYNTDSHFSLLFRLILVLNLRPK